MEIRTLIVDDEPLARERIRSLLESDTQIKIIGESRNGLEALQQVIEKKPGLVFLDIQMPEMNGFEMLQELEEGQIPHLIFVTAYDQYALRAFEYHALDYLLKPFDRERFEQALERAKEYIFLKKNGDYKTRLQKMMNEVHPRISPLNRVVVKTGGRIFFVKTEEIDWMEAAGNYINLHVGKDTYLIRYTMNDIEKKLDQDRFIRIHRSRIVNVECIKEIKPWFNGEYLIYLQCGSELTLSRKYRDRFKTFFDMT